MVAGLTFPHYSESRITFMPTYKYDLASDKYDTSYVKTSQLQSILFSTVTVKRRVSQPGPTASSTKAATFAKLPMVQHLSAFLIIDLCMQHSNVTSASSTRTFASP